MSFPKQKSFTVELHGEDIGRMYTLPKNVRVIMECAPGKSVFDGPSLEPLMKTSINFDEKLKYDGYLEELLDIYSCVNKEKKGFT